MRSSHPVSTALPTHRAHFDFPIVRYIKPSGSARGVAASDLIRLLRQGAVGVPQEMNVPEQEMRRRFRRLIRVQLLFSRSPSAFCGRRASASSSFFTTFFGAAPWSFTGAVSVAVTFGPVGGVPVAVATLLKFARTFRLVQGRSPPHPAPSKPRRECPPSSGYSPATADRPPSHRQHRVPCVRDHNRKVAVPPTATVCDFGFFTIAMPAAAPASPSTARRHQSAPDNSHHPDNQPDRTCSRSPRTSESAVDGFPAVNATV